MANYNKSFNFKKGLQVDTDNFVINANGLVGIGTSIPGKYLDVYGETRITGLATVSNLYVSGTSDFNSDLRVGSTVTLTPSGNITATNFYGNGNTLSNIVGYSTEAWIVNIAQTGLSTTLKVGIDTASKDDYDLVVGSGVSVSGNSGNIDISGTLTAATLSGSLDASNITGTISDSLLPGTITSDITGDLTGTASNATNLVNAANITNGTINDARLPDLITSSINSTGISTAGSLIANDRIGIGTNNPTKEFHIVKSSGNAELQIVSETGSSSISVAKTATASGVAGTEGGEIHFSNDDLRISNYDDGNLSFFLHRNATMRINI